jgi:hypothetical protein
MSLAPCRPSRPLSSCLDCARRTLTIPHNPEERTRTLLLDVSAILREGQPCSLFEAKSEPRYWWLDKREEVAA